MSDTKREDVPATCPCCRFVAEDLFLPPSPPTTKRVEDAEEEDGVAEINPRESWEQLVQLTRERKSEEEAHNRLSSSVIFLVDTHGHAHLDRDERDVYRLSPDADEDDSERVVVSLTCAVEEGDWQACLEYASRSPHTRAALGVHPWYLEGLSETWLSDLETLLQKHPGAMVGEIGLCKVARFVRTYAAGKQAALQLQRDAFCQQLRLAARLERPVSIHCVNQQGVMLDILKELASSEDGKRLPPAMALHSFTGTAHHVQQLLQWERGLKRLSSSNKEPLLYFGFSHAVNFAMCTSAKSRRQGRQAVRQVPRDRLLAESDVHSDGNVAAGTAGAVAYIAWALSEPIQVVADLTRRNGLRFLRRLQLPGEG